MVGNVAENILNRIAGTQSGEKDDYVGEDGLLYCGKCHTRKQHEIQWIDKSIRIVPVMCQCMKAASDAEKERSRKEEEMHNLRRARISSMMDDNFRTAVFDSYKTNSKNEKNYKVAMNYCQDFRTMYEKNQGLLLYGSVGTGKSFTAACIANYLLNENRSVVMTSFVRILQELQGFDREKEEAFANKLNTVSLLIVDDLGAERSTDYALEKVYGIIDSRYRAKKPLILTTNLTLEQMQENHDIRYERIYDRIFEMCFPLEFTGVSWRKREAAQRFDETRRLLEG